MISLKDILYVKTIAREGSFSQASEKLFISQPALSQAIQKLEERLGLTLILRRRNALSLTPAGRLFVDYGQPVLDSLEMLEQKMTAIVSIMEGTLRIGISQFYSQYHLSRFLPRFQKQFPGVSINLIEEKSAHLEQFALDGEVDFCMVPLPLQFTKLEHEILQHEEILFALPASHPLLAYLPPVEGPSIPFVNLEIARDEPFIFLKKQRFTDMGMRLCAEAGFTPHVLYETLSWDTVRAFIENDLGVGFLPEVMVPSTRDNSRLLCYRINGAHTTRPYAVAYRSRAALSLAATSFIRIAQEVFSQPLFRKD